MQYLFLIVLVLISSGCSLLRGKPKAAEPMASPATLSEEEQFFRNIKILEDDQFKKGGKVLVVPFSPDVNTAANEELERVSLAIVKGIADSLDTSSRFSVLDGTNAGTADLILQGRILSMNKTGRLKKIVTFKNKESLAVEGKMIDAKSGKIVFHFSNDKTTRDKKQTFVDLGSSIGRDIGKFLNSSQD